MTEYVYAVMEGSDIVGVSLTEQGAFKLREWVCGSTNHVDDYPPRLSEGEIWGKIVDEMEKQGRDLRKLTNREVSGWKYQFQQDFENTIVNQWWKDNCTDHEIHRIPLDEPTTNWDWKRVEEPENPGVHK